MTPPLLEAVKLVHEFDGGKRALNGASFQLETGEFLVLAGPNGSGKTVLMRHLNGLAKPHSGEVLLNGSSIQDNLPTTRCRVGLVFQDADAQIVGQTVAKDVAFGPENLRLPRQEVEKRVMQSLQATGLLGFHERRPHTLSGGEKRRLAVAGVLAMQPEVLVLDEPFTGLDWPGCADLLAVLDELHRGGTAILLITHDLGKVLAHANRLALMSEGQIVANGHPNQILSQVERYGIRRPPGEISTMSWSCP